MLLIRDFLDNVVTLKFRPFRALRQGMRERSAEDNRIANHFS